MTPNPTAGPNGHITSLGTTSSKSNDDKTAVTFPNADDDTITGRSKYC